MIYNLLTQTTGYWNVRTAVNYKRSWKNQHSVLGAGCVVFSTKRKTDLKKKKKNLNLVL